MNRILKINKSDIVFDEKSVTEVLNSFVEREKTFAIKGGFVGSDNIVLIFEKTEETIPKYVIAKMEEISEDALISEIYSRYTFGFSTILCFEIENRVWGIFSKTET